MLKVPQFPVKLPATFWGITNFFNPLKYGNKYENYRIFRDNSKRQGLNLITVELAFDNSPFILNKDIDAEILIQIRGAKERNLMWQGERLFNVGLEHLPDTCDKVCWIDCDIVFKNDSWIKETSQLLEKYVVVQPFEQAARLPKGIYDLSEKEFEQLDIGNEENQRCPSYVYKTVNSLKGFDATGFVWAARKAFIRKHLLYEHMLFGGGDSIMARSFMNNKIPEVPIRSFSTDAMRADQDIYASRVYKETHGSVYYTNGIIFHLWHGDEAGKLKFFRHKILQFFNFSPSSDIRIGSSGLLEWSSDKPEFHKAVGEYYQIRNEEGKGSVLISQIIDGLNTGNKRLKATELRLKAIETSIPYRIFQVFRRIYNIIIPSKKMLSFIHKLLIRSLRRGAPQNHKYYRDK